MAPHKVAPPDTSMKNPWLVIPEADYVGHMSSPDVGQRWVLNRLLHETVEALRPRAMLWLGCANGNGLEHIDPDVTTRVTAIDINPAYLRSLAARYPTLAFTLELHNADLSDCAFERDAYDLVHAALVFEYLDWRSLLPRLAEALRTGGALSVILQRESATIPAVTPSRFASLKQLESILHFVDPEDLVKCAGAASLLPGVRRTETLPSGKAFEVVHLVKQSGPAAA